jgi:hypothetical protein
MADADNLIIHLAYHIRYIAKNTAGGFLIENRAKLLFYSFIDQILAFVTKLEE